MTVEAWETVLPPGPLQKGRGPSRRGPPEGEGPLQKGPPRGAPSEGEGRCPGKGQVGFNFSQSHSREKKGTGRPFTYNFLSSLSHGSGALTVISAPRLLARSGHFGLMAASERETVGGSDPPLIQTEVRGQDVPQRSTHQKDIHISVWWDHRPVNGPRDGLC